MKYKPLGSHTFTTAIMRFKNREFCDYPLIANTYANNSGTLVISESQTIRPQVVLNLVSDITTRLPEAKLER